MQQFCRRLVRCLVWEWERSILFVLMVISLAAVLWTGFEVCGNNVLAIRSVGLQKIGSRDDGPGKATWNCERLGRMFTPPRVPRKNPDNITRIGTTTSPTNTGPTNNGSTGTGNNGPESGTPSPLLPHFPLPNRLKYNGFLTYNGLTTGVVTVIDGSSRDLKPVSTGDWLGSELTILDVQTDCLTLMGMDGYIFSIPIGKELLLR